MHRTCKLRYFGLLFAAVLTAGRPANAQSIYWVDRTGNAIMGANLFGSGEQIIMSGLHQPYALAVDEVGGKMYWTETSANRICRANLDGSAEQFLIGVTTSYGIALDLAAGKMYYTTAQFFGAANNSIRRANLNGTSQEIVIPHGAFQGTALGIGIDAAAGKIYWGTANPNLYRANLNGTNIETVLAQDNVEAIVVDSAAGKLYWAQFNSLQAPGVKRANLNGSNLQVLFQGNARGLALDLPQGIIYWSTGLPNSIRRARLDGSDLQTLTFSEAVGVALVGTGCAEDQACCFLDGRCGSMLVSCCINEGGTPQGPGSNCGGDPDADLLDTTCGDPCPIDPFNDADADGVCGPGAASNPCDPGVDNCPAQSNPAQSDSDADCVGDACDQCPGYDDAIDCNLNETPDGCDILNGTSLDENGNSIPDDCDNRCGGDVVPPFGIVDLDDILCVLGEFVVPGACPDADIFPCGGDGLIDVDDINAILSAFIDPQCPDPCPD